MYVVVRDTDPQLAADIANAHVEDVHRLLEGACCRRIRSRHRRALTTEFDDAETKLRDAEAALYQYQKDNDLLAVTLEERQSMVSIGHHDVHRKANRGPRRRIELQCAARSDAEGVATGRAAVADLVDGQPTSRRSTRCARSTTRERNKFIELEKEVGPKNPQYQMQKAKIDDLYAALQTEAKRMLAAVNEQLQAVIARRTRSRPRSKGDEGSDRARPEGRRVQRAAAQEEEHARTATTSCARGCRRRS